MEKPHVRSATGAVFLSVVGLLSGCAAATPAPAGASIVAGPANPPPIDLNATGAGLPTPDPATLTLGSAVYATHCASCHGPKGEGEPDWQSERPDGTLPSPPHDATGHTWHHSDAELLRIIRAGGTVYMPNSRMPAFGGTLSDAEVGAVLVFLKSLWRTRERAYQMDVTRQWEAMQEPGEGG